LFISAFQSIKIYNLQSCLKFFFNLNLFLKRFINVHPFCLSVHPGFYGTHPVDCLLETVLLSAGAAVYHLKVPQTIVGRLEGKCRKNQFRAKF